VRILYNILFSFLFALSSPYYFMRMRRRGNWRRDFGQRFGRYDAKFKQAITNRDTLWIHAVSVGEVKLCTQLIRALEPRLPNLKLVVSTTTTTGMAELQKHLPAHISRIYYPVDLRGAVSKALVTVRPEAIILVEAEIWPNFLWKARKMGIPTFLVNARLSNRSYRGYRLLSFIFKPLFAGFSGVGAQTEEDAARLRKVGFRPEAIRIIGSLKYDAAKLDERRVLHVPRMLRQLGVPEGAPVLLGGSTHPGEEAILADVFKKLREKYPNLFLVLVPRHFERSREVGKDLSERGVKFVFRNEVSITTQHQPGTVDCLVVNSTGELMFFYEHATVVFVGKSLAAQGGQNPIEPGSLARAMVFGPHMQNFSDIAKRFVDQKGAIQVASQAELESALDLLLSDPELRRTMGANALKVVQENLGAMDKTVDMIVQHLEGGDLYVKRVRV
jgi:3-deoxy-D-manno-octulosonic-acid transferase